MTVLRDVEVGSARVDVRIDRGVVRAVAARLPPVRGEDEVDGHGGALLPGLHDQHLHVRATAAARASVDCRSGLAGLASHPGDSIRGVGFSGSVDRTVLDALVPDRPLRVQHRSGALWMLNSAALDTLEHAGRLGCGPGVERDACGRPTGRLWRRDDLVRDLWPTVTDLPRLGAELAGYGITRVTDATPGLTDVPPLPQRVTLLGERKILLHDHDLPSYDELRSRIGALHAAGVPAAIHCVTRESLLLTLAVLDDVGRLPGERIEHASVVPDPTMLRGLHVVTQPAFVVERREEYRREVAADDLAHLYRYASLADAGIDVVASSDAPYGPLDPWQVIRAACRRELLPHERVSPRVALAGYLRDEQLRPRRVCPGAPADLVLLRTPLAEALDALDAACVHQILLPPST